MAPWYHKNRRASIGKAGVMLADGTVTLTSGKVKSGGTFTFSVDDVVKSGYTYDPGLNAETGDSVTVP